MRYEEPKINIELFMTEDILTDSGTAVSGKTGAQVAAENLSGATNTVNLLWN